MAKMGISLRGVGWVTMYDGSVCVAWLEIIVLCVHSLGA